jgi:hypothetical protein
MKILPFSVSMFLLIAIIAFVHNPTTSQNDLAHFYEDNNYVEGEIIVMFKHSIDANSFLNGYSDIGLGIKEVLVPDMNIYLFQYDNSRSQPVDALLSLMRSSDVEIAQFNHRFKERVIPNDTRFAEQWDKHNTGQSGGTVDADIDAPEAWEISTGGVTPLGDTIVVAIVDGGQQVTHTDLDTWRNHGEIAANGIDDDGNGYIDDIYGWHAGNNNGTIPSNSHGTHCAGIVGGRGNNSLGVAGVNWKVKTMPIAYGSATESNVIKAYGYALKQRRIYNQTNGAKGAFVVSTNSSFGIDYGRPVNYPLWCAFYDTLGNAGILSAGAGPNLNINIDIQGDIPTTCPSKFLIAVTNTTRTDAKNSGAGYGAINMDLGAPGTSILSTVPTNSYSSLTGTSMATPQVAGAIALLHAGAHSHYIQLMKSNPDSAAVLFKQFLLSTVDTIPSMTGITVSNGRLNLNKLLLKANTLNTTGVLNLNAVIEGFYDDVSGLMVPDTAKLYLRMGTSPYAIVDSSKSVIGSNSSAVFNFTNIFNGTPYYLVMTHRNSIETWSGTTQSFSSNSLSYDFTNSVNKAYGSNMQQVDASPLKYGIFSGDVDRNGNTDLDDILQIHNEAINFSAGYIVTDITGDNITELEDLLIAYNNSSAFVAMVRP